MTQFNLPRTHDGRTNLRAPTKPGLWEQIKDLGVISASLDVGDHQFTLDQVKSVPTLWGRVAIFENALSDPTHLAHGDAVSKWRALMAIVALREDESFKSNLKTVSVPLTVPKDDGHLFLDMVDKQRPKTTMDGEDGWANVHLLVNRQNQDDRLVAILSPSTLVAPVRTPNLAGLSYPWISSANNTGRADIHDPLKTPGWLTPDQLKVVQTFLQSVAERIKDKGLRDSMSLALDQRVDDFLMALKEQGSDSATCEVKTALFEFIPNLSATSILRCLNYSVTRKVSDKLITDCQVQSRAGLGKDPITIILSDPNMSGSNLYDRRPDLIVLVDGNRLNTSKSIEELRQETHLQRPNVLILTPDDIFSPFLVPLLKTKNDRHPEGLQDYLLPFKPSVFLFGDAEDIAKRTEVSGNITDAMTVSFSVNIIDRHGTVRPFKISREYNYQSGDFIQQTTNRILAGSSGDNQTVSKASPPLALAAWPDFQAKFWRQNYLYAVSQPDCSPIVTSGFSQKMLEADLADLRTGQSIFSRLELWENASGRWDKAVMPDWMKLLVVENPDDGAEAKKILQKSDYPFTAAIFSIRTDFLGDDTRQSFYAGLSLFERAEALLESRPAGCIALDFGTTNTTVYTKSESITNPVTFRSRLRYCSSISLDVTSINLKGFMPDEAVEQPFTTVAQIRDFQITGGVSAATRGQGDEILFKDYAFFDSDVSDMLSMIYHEDFGRSELRFDLKWSSKEEDRSMVGRYIGHLALLSLAELAAKKIHPDNVTWMFSYPMAMKDKGQPYINLVLDKALKPFGVKKDSVYFVTESDAALEYFDSIQQTPSPSRLLLDIGGGTTDVGIVLANKPIWRHSLQIAGGDLVSDFIGYNRDFIKLLELDDLFPAAENDDYATGSAYDKFADPDGIGYNRDSDNLILMTINSIVNSHKYAESFRSKYSTCSGTDQYEKLKAGAFLMLGGLLYYLGLQVRVLEGFEGVASGRLQDFDDVQICFAGRGSSLFRDLSEYEASDFEHLLNLFHHAIGDGGGKPSFDFARHIKHEAAHGMIAMGTEKAAKLRDSGLSKTSGDVARIFGADLSIKDAEGEKGLDGLQQLTDLVSGSNTRVERVDFKYFYDFIFTLQTAGLYVDLGDKVSGIHQAVKNELNSMLETRGENSASAPDIHSVNPPFISMLKVTLRLLYADDGVTANWAMKRKAEE